MMMLEVIIGIAIVITIFVATMSENSLPEDNIWEKNRGFIAFAGFIAVMPTAFFILENLFANIFIVFPITMGAVAIYLFFALKLKSKNPNIFQALGVEILCYAFIIIRGLS